MWTPIAFILLVAAASAEYGWKPSTQYRYEVTSRTLASLHETAHQYSGVSIKANLVIQPKDELELIARIEHAQYAQVQTPLEKGEDFKIPENELEYKSLQMSKEPVIIKLDQGVIVDLIISKEVPIWEVNIIRSIVSQLQVDTQGKNVIRSKLNMLPKQDQDTALFKTMEDTVDGQCETLYDITHMPKYTLQRNQHLVPQPQLIGQGQIFDVIKTKNFSNCEQRPGYHFGLTGMTQWEPATNQMGNFLTRSAISRVILSGNLKSYTIQSSVTTNRIIVSPEVSNIQKGEVISRVNLTLSSVSAANEEVQGPSNPQSVHKLVYDYNRAFIKDHEAREQLHKRQYATSESSSSSSSSSESSSVSSEEWHQDLPTMDQASEYPFLPYFVGYKGHSIQEKVNTVEIARKISEKVAEEMRTPEEIPRQSTLDRFTILTNVISTMNVKQLEQLTQELYVKEESESKVYPSQRRAMWMIYRDAVAQAGTNPSLLMIKKWIENQQIQGEEAAQVVALLPETAKTPTAEYMKNFFELVKKPEVMSQTNLNTSAIFAFSNLVRMAQVHKNSMHYRYPVHAFGRLSPKQEQAVVEEYIPYMAQQLRQAVQQEDSHKTQVYIRALGNMAHPKILRVFEPYLEGEQKMTDFQRTLVIVSLNKLAKVHPRLARSVLYKTYANTGESYQVRVAAVYNLMKTNPPASMLQRMAQFTHEDPSIQVRSAVKSAIESAATLTSESNAELRQNAQSAVDMLVPEVFGIQYSRSNMTDHVVRGLNLGYTQTLNYIGSEDSLIPKALLYHLQGDVNGYRQTEYRFGGMISSVQDFRDLLEDMLTYNEQVQHQQQQREDTFNAEKVHKFLNIEHQLKDQLEGNFLLQWASAQRFMTFDNHTIEAMPKQLNQLLEVLKNGKSFNYQKMYHQYSMMIGFPTSSGLPFIYSLHKPTYVWANGKVQLQLLKQEQLPLQSVQATSEIEMGFTTRRQAKISFVTPFDHTRYIAGHDRNLQVILPLKANFDLDLQTRRVKVELKPLNENKDYKILHVSAWPYIARHDILDFEPVSEHKNTRIIHLRQPHQIRQQFGESTGFVFRFEGKTERRFLDFKTLYEKIQQHNIVSALLYPTADETTQNNQYDLIFDGKHSSSKSMILTATYDYLDRQHQESEQKSGNMAIPSSVSIDSQSRRQEYLKRVKSGIKESTSSVVDLGVQFQGPKTVQFVATIAVASSPIDEQSNLLTYFRRVVNDEKFEICLDASSRMPFAPSDYEQATKNEPKAQVEAQLAFGERCQSGSQIVLNGKMERSQERREYLQRQPQTKQCEKEMKQESRFLSGCRNATLTANLFDKYAFTIKYDNLSKEFRNMTYQVYSVLRHLGYPHMSENPIVEGQQTNKIELDVQFRPDLTSADVFASLPNADVQFHNVRVSKYFRTLMVVHPTMNVAQRIGWSSLRQQYDAYCTIDRNQVRTFDNETYPIRIGNVWHVVLVSNPKVRVDGQYDNLHQLSVLVREDSQQQKEVQIVLYHTEETLFEFRPVADSVYGNFFVNGQRVEVSTDRVYEYRNKAQQVIVRVVVLPSGELRLVAPQHEFEFLYARVRFVINVAQVYRNRIGGLCGVFNGERYDFVTPQQYILRDPEQFAATWALSNEGRFAELKQEAQKYSDYKKVVILTNTISEQDAGRVDSRGRQHIELKSSAEDYDSSSSSSSASSSESKEYEQGSIRRIVVLERQGKHCFSLHPHTVCKNGYESKTMKTVRAKFVCVNKTQASSHWAQMVARGARPNLASKGNAQELQFPVPVKCTQL